MIHTYAVVANLDVHRLPGGREWQTDTRARPCNRAVDRGLTTQPRLSNRRELVPRAKVLIHVFRIELALRRYLLATPRGHPHYPRPHHYE